MSSTCLATAGQRSFTSREVNASARLSARKASFQLAFLASGVLEGLARTGVDEVYDVQRIARQRDT